MSTTQELIQQIRARFDHNESKKYLHEKYSNQLVVAYRSGLWKITPDFIALLHNINSTIILLDTYDVPIEVDTAELYKLALEKYSYIMKQWLAEYTELSNKR